jgi:antitoxin PrlF
MNKILHFSIEEHSSVKAFLDFLARDIKKNPSMIEPLTEDIFRRASVLTEDIEVDFDEELPEDFILT